MLGIIATIIAAKKGHTTFAWVVGIWSALEIILLLAKSPYAVGPGGVFIIIAACMTNLNKQTKPSVDYEYVYDSPRGVSLPNQSTPNKSPDSEVKPQAEEPCVAPLLCDVAGYVECPLCHTRQKIGRFRCFGCNAKFSVKPISPDVNNESKIEHVETLPEAAVTETSSDDIPKVRFCRKCGFKLLNNSDFCSHCGTKVVPVSQEPSVTVGADDITTEPEPTTEVNIFRDQKFWEHLQQLCVAAQEQFKEKTLPLLNDAGLLSASGNTVSIDINDMKRPLLVMAELWVFPIAVLVAALNEYLPAITDEDEKNIIDYLYSCGDSILQALQGMAKDESRILYGRMNDYNAACEAEMVCGFSSYGQGKLLFHDFEEFELCAGNKNHEAKCSLLFGDFLYYFKYFGSLPTLADISKLKKVVAKNSANYAEHFENLYMSVHPFVCALYSEVKNITGG